MPYSQKLRSKMLAVQDTGFNVFAMLHMYRKRSKIRVEVPEEVVAAICEEYFKRQGQIDKTFPYFLKVLQLESERYFARQNISESLEWKKSKPLNMAQIIKGMN